MNKRSFSHPGSIANGEIDTEFTPILHATDGKFCAADATFATRAELADALTRIEQLEATCGAMKAACRPVMDENGVWVSHGAWDAMERELAELRAKDADVETLQRMVAGLHKTGSESIESIVRLSSDLRGLRAENAALRDKWVKSNAPEGATE